MASRQPDKDKIFRKIVAARSTLILDDYFFGSLCHKLELVQDPPREVWGPLAQQEGFIPTFGTDGRHLVFDSEYAASLDFDETVGVICHEILHCSDGHAWRLAEFPPEVANIGGDFSIDPIIKDAGKKLPEGAHIHQPWIGKSAEWICREIMRDPQGCPKPQARSGSGTGKDQGTGPGGAGKIIPPMTPEAQANAQAYQADWQVATLQAANLAQAAGKLPAGLKRLVETITQPKIDYRSALRQWFSRRAKSDYSMRKPNRRFLMHKLWLPSLSAEAMPPVGILWDTSGSRDNDEARAECAAEVCAVIDETQPERVYVLYVDTQVNYVETFERGEPVEFHPEGGGGTSFETVVPYMEENEIEVCGLIGITDGYVEDWGAEPEFPTIWLCTTQVNPPWGETLRI